MKNRLWILLALLGPGLLLAPALRAVNDQSANTKVSALIEQLSSMKFSERSKASRELLAIGAPALEALRKATTSSDMETCRRARDLVVKIERRIELAALIAPTRVRLVCKDTRVTDAVADLAKQSKIELVIHPNSQAKLANKKVTLDTGNTTFWEAFDALCRKAQLVETTLPNIVPMAGTDPTPHSRIGIPVAPRIVRPAPVQRGGLQVVQANPVGGQQVIQVAIGNDGGMVYMPQSQGPGDSRIGLADGTPESVPTFYAGALRIRARVKAGRDKQLATIAFEVASEPRLKDWALVGAPRLDRAADDRDQAVAMVVGQQENRPQQEIVAVNNGRVVRNVIIWQHDTGAVAISKNTAEIQVKLGTKPARLLKEFVGQLTIQAKTAPERLIVVKDILKAAGKKTLGAKGGSITVQEVKKDPSGNYQVRLTLENPPYIGDDQQGTFGRFRAVQIQGRVIIRQARVRRLGMGYSGGNNISLLDAKGAAFPMIGLMSQNNNGDITQTLTFQDEKGREPAQLVFTARRSINLDLPVAFKDLKLP
jgi:hypothetical protein